MSKRIGQCMEPRSVGNVKYFCVEPAGHQCEHRYVPSIDDVERLAARVRELEAERDALRALLLKAYCYVAAHVPIGVKTDNDRKVLMLDMDAALARGEPTP